MAATTYTLVSEDGDRILIEDSTDFYEISIPEVVLYKVWKDPGWVSATLRGKWTGSGGYTRVEIFGSGDGTELVNVETDW